MSLDMFLRQQRALGEQMQGAWAGNPMDFWIRMGQQNVAFWKDMETNLQKAMGTPPTGDKTED
jgi:hypothetical protein